MFHRSLLFPRALLAIMIAWLVAGFLIACSPATTAVPTTLIETPASSLLESGESPPPTFIPYPEVPVVNEQPETPILTKMTLSHLPRLNEAVTIQLTVAAVLDAPGTTVEIVLPPGADLVSGETQWQGDLLSDRPIELDAVIILTEAGNLTFAGNALSTQDNGDIWGDASFIYIYADAEESQLGFRDVPDPEQGVEGP